MGAFSRERRRRCRAEQMKMDGGRGELALVTGCTGYIASHVVKAAHEAGYAVRGRCVRGRPGARPRGPHRADSR